MAPLGALIDGHRNCAYFYGCKQSPFINSQISIDLSVEIAFPGVIKIDNTRGIRGVEGRYVVYSIPPPSLPFAYCIREGHLVRHCST